MARSPDQIRHDLLVLRAQGGDRDAVRELVDLWQTRLWRLACAKLDDQEAAWDVVQDGWLSILRKLRQLRQPEAFGGWAMQIVAHAAAEHLRRARRQAEAIRAMSAEPAPRPAEQPATFDRRLLAGLTEPQLQAIILYYWEQMPLAQIAETLGVPVGTVKSRLYHARQNFKHLLGEEP